MPGENPHHLHKKSPNAILQWDHSANHSTAAYVRAFRGRAHVGDSFDFSWLPLKQESSVLESASRTVWLDADGCMKPH